MIYLHQKPALYQGTVEENLRFPFTLDIHKKRTYDRSRAAELLANLGRDDGFLDKSSHELSGGEAQIVALVCAIQLDPAVLLLDEPTASLDPATAQAVEAMLDGWMDGADHERSLLWVGHDRNQTLRMTVVPFRSAGGRIEQGALR